MSTQIIQIIVETIGVGLIGAVIALAGTYIRKYNLAQWVTRAVKAAEQLFPEMGTGEAKKQYVLDFIKNNLKVTSLTDDQINILIEAAVKDIEKEKEKTVEQSKTTKSTKAKSKTKIEE